jgi:cytochrome b involved in lipid metabolism
LSFKEFRVSILEDFAKIRYILLREAVYDISDFQHPGGKFILEAIKGREIGRFIYGGYNLVGHNFQPHKHSEFAINYLETRYIGDYLNESCPVLYIPADESQIQKNQIIWKLTDSKDMLENKVKLFTFSSPFFKVR